MNSSAASPLCRCCGAASVRSRGRKRGAFIRREFEFFACDDCGYLFVEPFAGHAIYNDDYYRGLGPDPYVDYAREYADYRSTDRMLEFEDLSRLATAHFSKKYGNATRSTAEPAALSWLDFGCGAGGLLKYLADLGTLAVGGQRRPLEIAGHDVGSYADLLRTRDRFKILSLEELHALPEAQFDVISLIEVIEHVEYPAPVIALAARLLRPHGLLLLTTGNNACPVARREGLAYRYYLPEIHAGIFNPRCLAQIYREHGLIPQHVRYSGVIKFKTLKSLARAPWRRLARFALNFTPLIWAIDHAYGVSAMPCAAKPAH